MADGSQNKPRQIVMSLKDKRDADGAMGWFVSKAAFPPRPAIHVKPLINGERAFTKVQEVVAKAQHSIDIMSWGFDPSMRMLPPDGTRIGDLLLAKAEQGVQVRVLIWESWMAAVKENNLPGNGLGGSGGTPLGSGMGSTSAGGASRSAHDNGYGNAIGNSAAVTRGDDEARAYNRDWFSRAANSRALDFHTQGFSLGQQIAIYAGAVVRDKLTGTDYPIRQAFLAAAPSHHQKMILIDYENPDLATGLVMGHNLMRNYWDTDLHTWGDPKRLGFLGWQDVSCQVWGPVLFDMNENFKRAWRRQTPGGGKMQWSLARQSRKDTDFAAPASRQGPGVVAQLCRTQSQEHDKSIYLAYCQAVDNARNYLYFENQYFRYKPLATRLRNNRRKLKAQGWKKDLYVFVVTNLPAGEVAAPTHEMLAELGQGSRMPSYEKRKTISASEEDQLRRIDLQGVHVHVTSLLNSGMVYDGEPMWHGVGANGMSSVSLPRQKVAYEPIYVHSKLLLTDDNHFLIGSANINERSMHVDSELCLNCPSPSLTRQWRHDLWKMHTRQEVGDDMKMEFDRWDKVLKLNSERVKKNEILIAPLLDFQSDVKGIATAD